jgi:hypothetical protein
MRILAGLILASMLSATWGAEPPVPAPASPPAVAKPLDLRVGNVRNYMMPNEFRAAVGAPDADRSDIVVEGAREPPPLKSLQPVPGGLASLWYAAKNPRSAWRIFAPDLNAPAAGPPPSPVPPPVFRWGP